MVNPGLRVFSLALMPVFGAVALLNGLAVAVDHRTSRQSLWPFAAVLFGLAFTTVLLANFIVYGDKPARMGSISIALGFAVCSTALGAWCSRWLLEPRSHTLTAVLVSTALTFLAGPYLTMAGLLALAVITGEGL
jgi:hypothetical protein